MIGGFGEIFPRQFEKYLVDLSDFLKYQYVKRGGIRVRTWGNIPQSFYPHSHNGIHVHTEWASGKRPITTQIIGSKQEFLKNTSFNEYCLSRLNQHEHNKTLSQPHITCRFFTTRSSLEEFISSRFNPYCIDLYSSQDSFRRKPKNNFARVKSSAPFVRG